MAELKRRHAFRRWAPDIGENRELEGGPVLFLEVATGLTAQELAAAREDFVRLQDGVAGLTDVADIKRRVREAFVGSFGKHLRVADVPHSIAGMSVTDIGDYVSVVQEQADFGQLALKDLIAVVGRFNSFAGPDELFLPRRSGGLVGTGAQSVVKDAEKTAAP